MKKLFLLLPFAFYVLHLQAQNVGIGTDTPAEKLDVNGNINIAGTIKANGAAGAAGQALISTGSGLTWGSLYGYRKCVMLTNIGNNTWTVPAGVTEVMVELWGGGSGGTGKCGGSSGGYARTVQTVTPGYAIACTIGDGSSYGTVTTSSGGVTQATLPLGNVSAFGGGGVGSGSTGGVYSGSGSLPDVFYAPGNSGETNISTFGQRNAGTYVEQVMCGAGGAPVGFINTTPVKGDFLLYENGNFISYFTTHSSSLPGAGGAAGYTSGWRGARGMIIIWYN